MKRIIFIFLILSVSFLMLGCQSAPERKNYSTEECYLFADCLYRNEKNDKSGCAVLGIGCTDALKEKRYYDRMKNCSTDKPKDMTENECRLFLNQK